MSISVTSQHLPELLQAQLLAAQEAGFYASETELIADAIRILLAARPDVRLGIACRLYERGAVSLGKAAELASLDVVHFKQVLHERGIVRTAPESMAETIKMAQTSLQAVGRAE